jgi:hypothetical protein
MRNCGTKMVFNNSTPPGYGLPLNGGKTLFSEGKIGVPPIKLMPETLAVVGGRIIYFFLG